MAERYWVGGSGNWSDATNHWATISGGTPGAGNLPTSADNANFDSLSNATGYTVTIESTANCLDFNMGAPLTGSVTLANSGGRTLNIYGNLNCSAGSSGMTVTATSLAIVFKATSGTKTIDTNGVSFATQFNGWTYDGVGGTFSLSNDVITGGNMITTNGSFTTNGFDVTCGTFSSDNSNTRSVTIDNSTINCGSWNTATTTNLTFSKTSSTIYVNTLSAQSFAGGGLTFADVELEAGTNGSTTVTGANTYGNLLIDNTGLNQRYIIPASTTQTVTGTLTVTGFAQGQWAYIQSSSRGTAATISAATVALTDCLFEDITGAGAASWSGTRVGNCGGNSGITFTTPVSRYWVGNGGNASSTTKWSTSSGGSSGASVPLPQDTAYVDAASFSSGSQTLTLDIIRIGNWDFTGVDSSPALTITASSFFYGDFLMTSGLGTVTTGAQTFRGRTQTCHLTGGGKSFSGNLTFDLLSTNTAQLTGAIATTGTITHTSGSIDFNGYTASSTTFNTSNSNTRALTSGTGGGLVLSGTGTVFTAATATNLTVTFTGGIIKMTDTSTTAKTFSGGGKTWGDIWWDCGTGTGNLDNVGSNTFADYKVTDSNHTLRFTAGTTTTVSTFHANGTGSGTKLTIGSITASGHTLTKSGGGTISCDYLSISRSTATPATTWYAGTNSTDGGNNSGWSFTSPSTNYSITDSSRYAIVKKTAITKSSKYTVDTEISVTKTSKYTVVLKQAVTKTSQYAVAVETPITKGSVYSVVSETSITKSTAYAIVSEQANTLSCAYFVVQSTANTKSSKYTIVSNSAQTQSSKYTITTDHSATLSSQYVVKNALEIMVSSAYLVVTEISVQKTSKYTVIVKIPVTKSSTYSVVTDSAMTKSSTYTVDTVSSITKSSSYCIVKEQSVALSSRYTITKKTAVQKASQYTVIVENPLTQSSIYRVITESAITLASEYIIGAVPRVTKTSQYTITRDVAQTKSSRYTITTPSAITKSSRYEVSAENALTKPNQYTVSKENTITKSQTYAVLTESTQTLSSVYRISREIIVTKSSTYEVLAVTESAITKPTVYNVRTKFTLTKSATYHLTSVEFQITKSITYHVLSSPYSRANNYTKQRFFTRQTNYYKY